ncbi:hypothetical protein [Afipia clevelandensis]|uniref:Uncharacterized protein n=1 Tax=Afipia clevelandensis ATCC 49720 TaxID=883079 RepID=K8PK94_9BRAD|nr:hypothetical protein [Afipia clevelandensis]EKS39945.1 hypothetical protein HMPREF9696_00957 [Afipia clevelandensis ATCC 49720]
MSNQTEPPSCSSAVVFIGKNSRGQWVAQEQNGLFGGLFVSRAAAIRYALFENGHHPETIMAAINPLELDMGGSASHGLASNSGSVNLALRRVA